MEKKRQSVRLGSIPFLAAWVAAHLVGWGAAFALFEFLDNVLPYNFNELTGIVLVALIPGMVTAFVQKGMISYAFRKVLKGWLIWSFVGWLLGGIAMYQVSEMPRFSSDPLPQILTLFTIPFVIQAFYLRHHVKSSWLWALVGISSAFIFAMPIRLTQATYNGEWFAFMMILIAATLQGLTTGMSALWLFHLNDHRLPKQKQDYALETAQKTLQSPNNEAADFAAWQEDVQKQAKSGN